MQESQTFYPDQNSSVIMEIRAGVGGQEAALFARDLFNMYSKYAQSQGWGVKILDKNSTDINGLKEISFQITGQGVLQKLKKEGGVHRVQRVPKTEKNGRVHTSTVSVAVLNMPKEEEFKIRPDELRVDLFASGGAGGQNVNKRETAVRIVHIPTGLVVTSQNERNQQQNKDNAMAVLRARLMEMKNSASSQGTQSERRAQIGTGDRSEKIRTYNFPQDRITDHRVNKSWHDIERIMEGKIDKIVSILQNLP